MRVDLAAGYELVLSAAVVASGEGSAATSLRQRAPDVAARITTFAPSDWMWAHLVTVVPDAPAPRDAAALLAHLTLVRPRELMRRLLGYYVRWFRQMTPPEVTDAAIRGDAAATKALLRTSQPADELWQTSLRARLDAGPERTKRDIIALLAEWHDRAVAPVTSRLGRQRRAAARQRASNADVASAFTGWQYVPEPGITRVVVVPSALLASIHEFEHEQTAYVCVPAVAPRAPRASEVVARAMRALADESRLAIVMALAGGPLSAQDLTDRTELGLPTVLHHLAALREARLVAGGGRRRAYQLRRGEMDQVAERIRGLAR